MLKKHSLPKMQSFDEKIRKWIHTILPSILNKKNRNNKSEHIAEALNFCLGWQI